MGKEIQLALEIPDSQACNMSPSRDRWDFVTALKGPLSGIVP